MTVLELRRVGLQCMILTTSSHSSMRVTCFVLAALGSSTLGCVPSSAGTGPAPDRGSYDIVIEAEAGGGRP